MTREVEAIADQLARIQGFADAIRQQLTDLHSLAYERHVGDKIGGAPQSRKPHYPDEVGSSKAKAAWRHVEKQSDEAHRRLESALNRLRNLMMKGREPDLDVFIPGTTLISATEFAERLVAQARARARGDYVPEKNNKVDQPGYPSQRGLCWHCKELPAKSDGLCPADYAYRQRTGQLASERVLRNRRAR